MPIYFLPFKIINRFICVILRILIDRKKSYKIEKLMKLGLFEWRKIGI